MFVNDKLPFKINIPLFIPPFHCSRCEAGTQTSKKFIYSQWVVEILRRSTSCGYFPRFAGGFIKVWPFRHWILSKVWSSNSSKRQGITFRLEGNTSWNARRVERLTMLMRFSVKGVEPSLGLISVPNAAQQPTRMPCSVPNVAPSSTLKIQSAARSVRAAALSTQQEQLTARGVTKR